MLATATGITIGSLAFAVAFGILGRHEHRGELLEPVMNAIGGAEYCYNSETGTCAALLAPKDVKHFDLSQVERPLFGFLYAQVAGYSNSIFREMLSGAHVEIEDPHSAAYEFLIKRPGAHQRISSHQSDDPQYGVPEGRVVRTLLVGTLEGRTWFQLEGSPWDPVHQVGASMGHALDTLEYAISRRNIGPLGTSNFTDRAPLLMDGRPLDPALVCHEPCAQQPV
mmetsp:Transcript_51188/g.136666  ORF Transcript_51188/g.136666 Transcript_51188/m.136666 type:complete len:224 (-) Transcript_51188:98-769(-)